VWFVSVRAVYLMAELKLKAQPFIAQINNHGESAYLWQPTAVGSSTTAAAGDKSNLVWTRTATTVLVIRTQSDIALDNGTGYVPRGSVAVRFNANILVPDQRAVLVLTKAGRVRRATAEIKRAASGDTDTLNHPFVVTVQTVRSGDTSFTNWSLTANSDPNAPFAPDSLLWLTGSKPAAGDKYGATYTYHPQFDMLTGPANMAMMGDDDLLMPVTLPLLEKPTGGDH
jgi:hypothetical protein